MPEKDPYLKISISAGSHLDIWQHKGVDIPPFNFQVDFHLNRKQNLGVSYIQDVYSEESNFFEAKLTPGKVRQNISLRYYYLLNDPEKVFVTYIGCTAGASFWTAVEPVKTRPTVQFLYGMKIRIFRGFFWQHEFGLISPFVYQSSVGYTF
ncbi:MAG: hypothetical protein JNL60_08170 [Bacteroidia bacterium]|nr:hypothetical protein [Bacteroidia bacterium]